MLATATLPQDPALTARTFSQNPTLTAALNRIRAQHPITPTPEPVNTGAEVPGGDDSSDPHAGTMDPALDVDRPTEQELNEVYLYANGWNLVSRGDDPHDSVWLDQLSGDRYFFDSAMTLQEGRDMANGFSFAE